MKQFIKQLGPGILFASMAIGTSHLVLSTKAGAEYGLVMLVPLVLANLIKYPFFEFGVRFTHSQKISLIQGYADLGKIYLWIYALITLVSTFTILAALYLVTSGLLANLLGLSGNTLGLICGLLFLFNAFLLYIGKYALLEKSLKFVVLVLLVALVITTILVFYKPVIEVVNSTKSLLWYEPEGILFLIGLIGWMPTAVEASGWVSLWNVEKEKLSPKGSDLKAVLREFNFGYMLTSLLAILFFLIGWKSLYGTGIVLSEKAVQFSNQLVQLFTEHMGAWAYIFIAIAAFATMYSTCLSAHDALSRVSIDVLQKLSPKKKWKANTYIIAVFGLALINWIVVVQFKGSMVALIALATFCSFVFAPLLGWMNIRVLELPNVPLSHKPKKGKIMLAWTGIVLLTLLALYYCWIIWMA